MDRVFQDDHGRAIQASFAVIDYSKWEDKPNDIHSSKYITIPLSVGRLITVLNEMARSLGQPDFYPFAMSKGVVKKLHFIALVVEAETTLMPGMLISST